MLTSLFPLPASAPVHPGSGEYFAPAINELNTFDDVALVGAKWVRISETVGLAWSFIESTKSGGKGSYNWTAMDYVVSELQQPQAATLKAHILVQSMFVLCLAWFQYGYLAQRIREP